MSGNHSIRGYVVQTLMTILDSFTDNNQWLSVTLEPVDESEKVDILWEFKDGISKVSQVKSTMNTFSYSNVLKWCSELENTSPSANSYELILIGHCQQKVLQNSTIGKVHIPNPKPLNIESLMEQASNRIDTYYEKLGRPKLNASLRRILVNNLVTEFELSSIVGETLTRPDFDQRLITWVSQMETMVKMNPLIGLTPIEAISKENLDHEITKKILQMIGWNSLEEHKKITIVEEGLNKDVEYKTNFYGTWRSRLKDDTRDITQIKSRIDHKYYPIDLDNIRAEIREFNAIYHNVIIDETEAEFQEEIKDMYSVLFWYSSNIKEHETALELVDHIKDKYLIEKTSYIIVDNNFINFLASSVVAANNYHQELRLKFLYPITEANLNPENIGKRDLRMPPQFLNSRILPIIIESSEKISVLLFCKDPYDPEHLKKLVWLTIRLTSGFGNEYVIFFPDFDPIYQNESKSVISQFENEEILSKLRVEKYNPLNSEVLAKFPLPENLRIEKHTKALSNAPERINDVFTNQLPYGDILKPFLNTEAVTANDIKFFLAKRGIFVKGANRKSLVDLMCTRLFSPAEIEDFIAMIDVKEKPLKSVPDFKKLVKPTTISEVSKSLPALNKTEILKDLNTEIVGNLRYKQNPDDNNELILEITTSKKDLTSQLLLNTTWGKVLISIKVDEKDNLLTNTISTATKHDKILANRIIKITQQALEENGVIQSHDIKVMFSQFRDNIERVNFLLSFSDLSTSTVFKDQDISNIKFKYDETLEIPESLRDKKSHDLITFFKGKNLAELSELSDEEFKRILLLEEVSIIYTTDWNNIKNIRYQVKYNFSNAIFNKTTFDGEFSSEPLLFKDHKVKKITNIQKLEKMLAKEIARLRNEKIKEFNLV
ncbi:MAG: hypothetical protein RIC80_03505 [Cyclobacteriaceae bacterium]